MLFSAHKKFEMSSIRLSTTDLALVREEAIANRLPPGIKMYTDQDNSVTP